MHFISTKEHHNIIKMSDEIINIAEKNGHNSINNTAIDFLYQDIIGASAEVFLSRANKRVCDFSSYELMCVFFAINNGVIFVEQEKTKTLKYLTKRINYYSNHVYRSELLADVYMNSSKEHMRELAYIFSRLPRDMVFFLVQSGTEEYAKNVKIISSDSFIESLRMVTKNGFNNVSHVDMETLFLVHGISVCNASIQYNEEKSKWTELDKKREEESTLITNVKPEDMDIVLGFGKEYDEKVSTKIWKLISKSNI